MGGSHDTESFFKQKTAYEIGVRLVGSEMCIRDRDYSDKEVVIIGSGAVSYTHLTLPTTPYV